MRLFPGHAATWAQQAVAGYGYNNAYTAASAASGGDPTQYYGAGGGQCSQTATPWTRHPQATAKAVDVPPHWPDNYR